MRAIRRTFSMTTAATNWWPWPDGRLLPSQSLQNDRKVVRVVSVNSAVCCSPAVSAARSNRISSASSWDVMLTFSPRYSLSSSCAALSMSAGATGSPAIKTVRMASKANSACNEYICVGCTVRS